MKLPIVEDSQLVRDRLAALAPRDLAFADTLRHMANEYRSKAILDLVERHLRMEQTS